MPDTKITALTALTAADPANDVLPIVDVSDTTMAASGTTKKISINNVLGCSGTATLASATITGDLTVDTSTLKVDSANDRVGFGTASPAQVVHLSKSNTSTALTSPPVGNASLRIQNTSSTNNNFGSVEFYNAAGLFGASINCQHTNQSTPTNDLVFVVRNSGGGLEAARLDSSGNVGIGVTPSAWAIGKIIQLASATGSFLYGAGGQAIFGVNAYYDTAWKYGGTGAANYYQQSSGIHAWFTAPSGTAGNAISFTQAMTLDASGNLGCGITNPSHRIHALVSSGADRDIFAAQVLAASNGLQVKWNHATTTLRIICANLPTSSAGLASGTLWNDAGTIKIA